ncbi:hypothetical protein Dimus_035491 [Dionaea muscipula]
MRKSIQKKRIVAHSYLEYIKEVWEESKYTKPLEITRRFANNETLTAARRVKSDKKGQEPKRYDYFEETFLTLCKLKRENEIWWIGTGEKRRRDDEIEAPTENVHEEEVEVIDEAAIEGESGSGEKFYDVEDEVQESPEENEEVPAVVAPDSAQQKEQIPAGVDPSGPSGHIPESVINKLQAEFERARVNRF